MSNLRVARDSSHKVKQTCTETNENCKCTPCSSGCYPGLETSGNCMHTLGFKELCLIMVRPVKHPSKTWVLQGPRGGPTRGPREVARGPREVVVRSCTFKSFSLACKECSQLNVLTSLYAESRERRLLRNTSMHMWSRAWRFIWVFNVATQLAPKLYFGIPMCLPR